MQYRLTFYELIDRLREFIKARINAGDFTESSLARALHISQPHLHNMLKGVRRMSVEFSDDVMKEFGISLTELIKEGDFKEFNDQKQRKPATGSLERDGESASNGRDTSKRRPA